jgi:energy-coupling factor transporter transmembrane protein EcfT
VSISLSDFGLRPVDGINLLTLLFVIWMFIRVMNSETNTIVYADFISTLGADGKQHGDINKLGQTVGIVIAALCDLLYAHSKNMDAGGLALVLSVTLAYFAAVKMYATYLKSKQGSIETTRTVEPMAAPVPIKVTDTTKQTAPIAPLPAVDP